MKKLISLLLALIMLLSVQTAGFAEDKITISILSTRSSTATNTMDDIYFFKYLAKRMNDLYGYNIEFELEQTMETGERVSLMLATGDLPDLVWGIQLKPIDAVVYGAGEGMLLDWTPYINENDMPNLYNSLQRSPDARAASICTDGKIYGLPYIGERGYIGAAGAMTQYMRTYVNEKWLEACGVDMPATLDEFVDMLRAFKNMKLENGDPIPAVQIDNLFRYFVWDALGFIGSNCGVNGMSFAIKNGEVVLPCYTEEYRAFVTFFNTLYKEGLISEDYITMDKTTAEGLISAGRAGVISPWTLIVTGDAFMDYVPLQPLTSEYCDKMIFSANTTCTPNATWASATTEHPEVLAKIMDFMYTGEATVHFGYGPMAGSEYEGEYSGWFFTEDGTITNQAVEDGLYKNIGDYTNQYVKTNMYSAMDNTDRTKTMYEMAGREFIDSKMEIVDALTGKTFTTTNYNTYNENTPDGHWRLTTLEAWRNNVTIVRLPDIYLTEEEATRANDLKTALDTYVSSETAKFIVGERPLSELDGFFDQLRKLNVEEYINIYRTAYQQYMDSIFSK